jgi:hypothetical protein
MLENIMALATHRSRIHLLPAKNAPIIVILQRKRADLTDILDQADRDYCSGA